WLVAGLRRRLTWLARPSYERHAFGLPSQGGRPMRDRRVALGLAAILILSGCSAMRERRWSYCAVAGGLAGAAVGAGTAGGLVNAYEKNRSDEHTGAAAGGGAVVGADIGALLGHVTCDPTEEAPPPPHAPPAPPPPPAPTHTELPADPY